MPSAAPFWKTKRLQEMSREEWEVAVRRLRPVLPAQAARRGHRRAFLHQRRLPPARPQILPVRRLRPPQRRVPDCVSLTPEAVQAIDWLPPSCGYRRLAEGKDLAWWHPLVSGDPNTVHEAGISVRGRAVSERRAGALEAPHRGLARPAAARPAAPRKDRRDMMRDALSGGINAAVVTRDERRPLARPRSHGRRIAAGCWPMAATGWPSSAPPARPTASASSERIACMEGLVERGIPAAKMLPGTGTTAITDTVLLTRHADGWAAAARCCCRRSTTRTRPTTGCSRISAR